MVTVVVILKLQPATLIGLKGILLIKDIKMKIKNNYYIIFKVRLIKLIKRIFCI